LGVFTPPRLSSLRSGSRLIRVPVHDVALLPCDRPFVQGRLNLFLMPLDNGFCLGQVAW
jgi:hypothetical protein